MRLAPRRLSQKRRVRARARVRLRRTPTAVANSFLLVLLLQVPLVPSRPDRTHVRSRKDNNASRRIVSPIQEARNFAVDLILPGRCPRCSPQVSRHRYSPLGRTYPTPRPNRASAEGRSTGFALPARCPVARRNRPSSQSNGPFQRAAATAPEVARVWLPSTRLSIPTAQLIASQSTSGQVRPKRHTNEVRSTRQSNTVPERARPGRCARSVGARCDSPTLVF